MNKAGKVALITASVTVAALGGVLVYNRYYKVNESLLADAVNADPVVSALSGDIQKNVVSIITKKINRLLLNVADVNEISNVAKLDNISFEKQLFVTAKARCIADGYLSVTGEII